MSRKRAELLGDYSGLADDDLGSLAIDSEQIDAGSETGKVGEGTVHVGYLHAGCVVEGSGFEETIDEESLAVESPLDVSCHNAIDCIDAALIAYIDRVDLDVTGCHEGRNEVETYATNAILIFDGKFDNLLLKCHSIGVFIVTICVNEQSIEFVTHSIDSVLVSYVNIDYFIIGLVTVECTVRACADGEIVFLTCLEMERGRD